MLNVNHNELQENRHFNPNTGVVVVVVVISGCRGPRRRSGSSRGSSSSSSSTSSSSRVVVTVLVLPLLLLLLLINLFVQVEFCFDIFCSLLPVDKGFCCGRNRLSDLGVSISSHCRKDIAGLVGKPARSPGAVDPNRGPIIQFQILQSLSPTHKPLIDPTQKTVNPQTQKHQDTRRDSLYNGTDFDFQFGSC